MASQQTPSSISNVISQLSEVANLSTQELSLLSPMQFLRIWHSFQSLFPGLHPDDALCHGVVILEMDPLDLAQFPNSRSFAERYYEQSGWPVALTALGNEAWRRYETRELSDEQLYCIEAQKIGLIST